MYKNAFINLAIGMFVFSEPDEVTKTTDKDFDPMLLGPVKAVPPSKDNIDSRLDYLGQNQDRGAHDTRCFY